MGANFSALGPTQGMDISTLAGHLLADAHEQLSDAAASLSLAVPATGPVGAGLANDIRVLAEAVERELLAVEATLNRLADRTS